MSRLDDILDAARREAEDVEFTAVKAWKAAEAGRRCVGFFPVYVPEELIWAGGALPVGIWGAGGSLEVEAADARLQSFICSVSRSTLELGLTGRLDFLDGMLFGSLCDVARNLSGVWARNLPGMLCDYLHYPQNPASAHARSYYREELEGLARRLEAAGCRMPSDEELAAAVDLYERQRSLLRELAAARNAEPWRLSLEEFAILLRSSGLRDPRRQNEILEEVLAVLPGREARPRDGIRVVLEGSFCEQPPLELLRVLDAAHCFVVSDDLARGVRWFREPLRRHDDPWEDLVGAYFDHAEPSVVRHRSPSERSTRLLERVREAGADGVVFCTAKFCEPALYDFVLHKRALERAGIPFLAFEFEEKMGSFDSVRTQAETFSESILFFAEEMAS